MIAIIAAYSKTTRVIGNGGGIPWNIPDDLHRFKCLTEGNAVIFGRKTFESIGHPLKNRLNIVITRSTEKTNRTTSPVSVQAENPPPVFARGLEEAFLIARRSGYEKLFVCGGQGVYEAALSFCDTLYLTEIDKAYEGDAFFPRIDESTFEITERIENDGFTYITMKRKSV